MFHREGCKRTLQTTRARRTTGHLTNRPALRKRFPPKKILSLATPYNASVRSYKIVTLGCRVNHYESLQVAQLLDGMGYSPANGAAADLIVVNTCSVTTAAAAKSRNLLRRFAHRSGESGTATVLGIGCWTTSNPREAAETGDNVIVLGHSDDLAAQIGSTLSGSAPAATAMPRTASMVPPARPHGAMTLPALNGRQELYQRALLKVQDGCDAHCSYCIIPKLRPAVRSRPAEDIVEEARRTVDCGHRELVLTGVFLGAYGQETTLHRRQEHPGKALAELVGRLCTQVTGLLRVRLSSLEPGDVSPELIGELAAHEQVMPHFHLPMQSGADTVLRKMNRQYGTVDYRYAVDRLKSRFDRPALTTDVIVGFPGETDQDFDQTLQLVRDCGFLHVHAFPFSPREGTAAAKWKQQMIPPGVVTERMQRLAAISAKVSMAYRQQFVGQTVNILVEHPGSAELTQGRDGYRCGRCERYFAVHFQPRLGREMTGELVKVRVERVSARRTTGALA